MWKYQNTDELYHHGVLGMKWGVRRQAINNVNRSNKFSRKLHTHGIGGEEGYTPEFAKRRNAKMMTKGLQDGTLKRIPKGYKKVDNRILTDKQAIKETNRNTKKNISSVNKAFNAYKKNPNKETYDAYKKIVDDTIKRSKMSNYELRYDFVKDRYWAANKDDKKHILSRK